MRKQNNLHLGNLRSEQIYLPRRCKRYSESTVKQRKSPKMVVHEALPTSPSHPVKNSTEQMINSSVRAEVRELKKLGSLPSEDDAEIAQLKRIEELYRSIARPVTDAEACVLVELFGPDGCYGLAFSFIHLIETAPGWPLKQCFQQLNNDWKIELRNRAIRDGYQL